MSIPVCPSLTIINYCASRATIGRVTPARAFVLHCIPYMAVDYLKLVNETAGSTYPSNYPKSTNYFVDYSGNITELVPIADTAWGLDKYDQPTWPDHVPGEDENAPFIHIGYEGDNPCDAQLRGLTNLLCCLSLETGIPIDSDHLLAPVDLDVTRCCPRSINAKILVQAKLCVDNGGIPDIPSVYDLLDRVEVLEALTQAQQIEIEELMQCCTTHTTEIAALQAQVADLYTKLCDCEQINEDLDDLREQIQVLIGIIKDHQECIDETCGTTIPECIQYQLLAGQEMMVTPGVDVWLNLPTKITDSEPPTVITGPLWSACLTEPCTYGVDGTARLEIADYCAGRIVRLYLVHCGQKVLLDEYTATDGAQSVTVSGSTFITVPPECKDTHLAIYTDDDTTPFKTVEFANITICC